MAELVSWLYGVTETHELGACGWASPAARTGIA